MVRTPHRPQRTCVACRQVEGKSGLLRVVRTPQGEVRLDETGKLPGRGAYVCRREQCVEQAIRQKKLGRALGVAVSEEIAVEARRRVGATPGEAGLGEGDISRA